MKAIYAFSGDPITKGHIDIIERAYKIFPDLVIGIGENPEKKYTFTLEERLDMAKKCVGHLKGVTVISYEGLLIDYAYENNIDVMIRGIRNNHDLDYEYNFYLACKSQELKCETIPMFASPKLAHVSSSVVKSMTKEQGKLETFVTLYVKQKLEEKMLGQYIISMTGAIGCGKSYVTNKFVELGGKYNIPVYDIDLDKVSHEILSTLEEPKYVDVRKKIIEFFGSETANEDGSINRKVLGDKVFKNKESLKYLDDLMLPAINERMRREMYGKKGLIIINAALLIENDYLHYSNNNVVIVTADKEVQRKRLKERNYTDEQIENRIASQFGNNEKIEEAKKVIEKTNDGMIWILDTTSEDEKDIEDMFLKIRDELKIPESKE